MNRRSLIKGAVGLVAVAAVPTLPVGATETAFPQDARPWDIYVYQGKVCWLSPSQGWVVTDHTLDDYEHVEGPILLGNAQPMSVEDRPTPTKLFEISRRGMSDQEVLDHARSIASIDGSIVSHTAIEPDPFVIHGIGYPHVIGVYGWRGTSGTLDA